MHDSDSSFPAGGIFGAIAGEMLFEQFAWVGSLIIAGAAVLLSLALTADGILAGLGLRGLIVFKEAMSHLQATAVLLLERQRHLRDDGEMDDALPEHQAAPDWTFGAQPTPAADKGESLAAMLTPGDETQARVAARHDRRIDQARKKGQALAEAAALAQANERNRRHRHELSDPAIAVDQTIDFAEEEEFEFGDLPLLDEVSETALRIRERLELNDSTEPSAPSISILAAGGPVQQPQAPAAPPRAAVMQPIPSDDAADQPSEPALRVVPQAARPPQPQVTLPSEAPSCEPEIVDRRPAIDISAIDKAAEQAAQAHAKEARQSDQPFELPSPTLLDIQESVREVIDAAVLRENAQKLIKTLKSYGIDGQIREIRPGPVITMYEFVPAPGIKISKIATLADDLAMSMEALRVRIVAPIPGRGAVGIEIPNETADTVFLKELITHDSFQRSKKSLPMALGKDIEGNAYVADLAKMPHLLVAGATGAGKSVSINSMIMSILFNASPRDVRMLMVDPKMLELSVYDGIPHLLLPVVTDPQKAALALRWAVQEMERRYRILSSVGVRNIAGYNQKVATAEKAGEKLETTITDAAGTQETVVCEHLPFLVVIVDEFADLMMVASREVEASIMRLAQKARAAGIHLILATQRPSVDVLTGVIKANFPTRIAFQVASRHDSRTILDANGAEHLLGRGDMLYLSPGAGGMHRVHGAYVSEDEIERTVNFLRAQGTPDYDESILVQVAEEEQAAASDDEKDEFWDQALAIVTESQQASISMIQRRLRIGYNRAARLIEQMEAEGIVGPADGAKPRQVLLPHNPL